MNAKVGTVSFGTSGFSVSTRPGGREKKSEHVNLKMYLTPTLLARRGYCS